MYKFIALIQLIIFIFIISRFIKKHGLVFLVDQVKIMFILWFITLILYDFQFSTLYNPTVTINLIVILMLFSFLVLSRFIHLEEDDIKTMFKDLEEDKSYKLYRAISNIIFVVGATVFFYNAYKYGLRILEENKIDKQQIDHYAGYIVYMLALSAEIKYILYRNYKKIIDLIILIGSIVVLGLTLNRGPIAFLFVTIGLYEIFRFITIKEKISKKKTYIIYGSFIFAIIVFVAFFGYIGNLRMEYVLQEVYNRSIWEHYGVSTLMPSGALWVYIYITSPLENAAYSISNQKLVGYSFLCNLFYPFIKFLANIVGKGGQFKTWLISQGSYTPYLDKIVGLNASSFITEAFQDLGIIGFILYLVLYLTLAYLSIKLIKSRRNFTFTGRIIIYSNITSILLWSIFVNSFKIPILILNILLVLTIEVFYSRRKERKENE